VIKFRGFDKSRWKRVLNPLEVVNFRLMKVVINRIVVVEFGVNHGGGNGKTGPGIEVWADTVKMTYIVISGFREG